jgi:hypothetical protein
MVPTDAGDDIGRRNPRNEGSAQLTESEEVPTQTIVGLNWHPLCNVCHQQVALGISGAITTPYMGWRLKSTADIKYLHTGSIASCLVLPRSSLAPSLAL